VDQSGRHNSDTIANEDATADSWHAIPACIEACDQTSHDWRNRQPRDDLFIPPHGVGWPRNAFYNQVRGDPDQDHMRGSEHHQKEPGKTPTGPSVHSATARAVCRAHQDDAQYDLACKLKSI